MIYPSVTSRGLREQVEATVESAVDDAVELGGKAKNRAQGKGRGRVRFNYYDVIIIRRNEAQAVAKGGVKGTLFEVFLESNAVNEVECDPPRNRCCKEACFGASTRGLERDCGRRTDTSRRLPSARERKRKRGQRRQPSLCAACHCASTRWPSEGAVLQDRQMGEKSWMALGLFPETNVRGRGGSQGA